MRDVSELEMRWSGPGLRREDVEALEAAFGLTLPPDYLTFLSLVIGGVPRTGCYCYRRKLCDSQAESVRHAPSVHVFSVDDHMLVPKIAGSFEQSPPALKGQHITDIGIKN